MHSNSPSELNKVEEILGYRFKNHALLEQALTHSSYANEYERGHLGSNERLEFLGDAVLDMEISDEIFARYRQKAEGELTKMRAALVCEQSLAAVGMGFGLNEYLLLGKGEEGGGGRYLNSIVADCMEAIIGAVYLDGGHEASSAVILKLFSEQLKLAGEGKLFKDSKTELQEYLQRKGNCRIEYTLTGEEGPDHAKLFSMTVSADGKAIGSGSGRSKKQAEAAAAADALEKIKR